MSRSAGARERGEYDGQLVAVAASVGRAVRGGSSLLEALGDVGLAACRPGSLLETDLRRICREAAHGRSVEEVLERWRSDRPLPCVELFVAACRFGHAHGGDLAAALEGVAVSLLDRVELADEARALATQARASAGVLVALPLVGAAGFSLLDPRVVTTLLTTTPGLLCLVVGLGLDAAGALVAARLVKRALR